jgi:hypothetical protein
MAETIVPVLGATFDAALDAARLGAQQRKVYDLMQDGAWRTLYEIACKTGAPEASASARLRDLRRAGLVVERRRMASMPGLWEYRVVMP